LAYKSAGQTNRNSHLKNKKLYDRKAKLRSFQAGDFVYLYNPAMKPGLCRKFSRACLGPHKVTANFSDLNYDLTNQNNRKQIVHLNWLKNSYNADAWGRKQSKANDQAKTPRKTSTRPSCG
jgi:hypothetical protein